MEDLLGYSNIEEENVWFGVPVAGISKEIRDSRLFIGVRNLNEDYFITDNMSFFTNSSCGIFPTLSTNMPLANYPFSSMCIDYQYQTQTWGIRASIYNGRAYNKWRKNENAFIINPGRDGILQPGEVNYNTQRSKFHLGYALNTKNILYEKDRVQPWLDEPIVKEKTNLAAFIWQYLEHKLWENARNDISRLCQYSRTLTRNSFCKQYEGAGAVWNCKDRRDRENSLGFIFSAEQFYEKRIN